jgi:hypothetical protein
MLNGLLRIYPLALGTGPVHLYDGDTCQEQGKKLMAEMVIRVDRLSATCARRADLVQALQDVSLEIQKGYSTRVFKKLLLTCAYGLCYLHIE